MSKKNEGERAADSVSALIRAAKAEAWEEGYDAGADNLNDTHNPYWEQP